MSEKNEKYYIPNSSPYPLVGTIGIFLLLFGFVNWIHEETWGMYCALAGLIIFIGVLCFWFRRIIKEYRTGLSTAAQVQRAYRWGVFWFLFTEALFFFGLFFALFYVQVFGIKWLAGEGHGAVTHLMLWPNFQHGWPVMSLPNPNQYTGPAEGPNPWGIPLLNTLVILISVFTITMARKATFEMKRKKMLSYQMATILLAVVFLVLQGFEYYYAYTEEMLKLGSGIYGNIFYFMTGFDGLHVVAGIIMLLVIFFRMKRGDYDSQRNLGVRLISWYWYFVAIVWILLFLFLYII